MSCCCATQSSVKLWSARSGESGIRTKTRRQFLARKLPSVGRKIWNVEVATCFTFTISDCVCTDSAHCPLSSQKECDQNQQDSLHGVLSRTSGLERLTHIEACQQTEHVHLLALLDIDQLRQFNERHGYERGDIALQNTINTLLHQLRAKEFVCRLGMMNSWWLCQTADVLFRKHGCLCFIMR